MCRKIARLWGCVGAVLLLGAVGCGLEPNPSPWSNSESPGGSQSPDVIGGFQDAATGADFGAPPPPVDVAGPAEDAATPDGQAPDAPMGDASPDSGDSNAEASDTERSDEDGDSTVEIDEPADGWTEPSPPDGIGGS